MEMEDHHHQHQQYGGITDLRQLVSNNGPRSTHFPTSIPPQPTAELFPGHPNLAAAHQQQHYELMMFGRQVADLMPRCLHDFADASNNNTSSIGVATATTPTTTTSASTPPLSGLGGAEAVGCLGGDASTGRWPRQETLTLLEIRSRLDPKFKEANQKGPLWDEVSRIMSEEHGYQRSGKKCREKFENLYKYYKKTKEGKAGRQDGKHYRFFRQLEALYGESNSNNSNAASAQETNFGGSNTLHYQNNPHAFNSQHQMNNQEMLLLGSQNSLSLTNSTEFETSSSDDDDHNSTGGVKGNDESMEKRRKKRGGSKSWKVKIKDFIDLQMRKLVQKQEEWLDKLMKTLEQKEKERVLREEEWRRQEAARLEREHKFWAKERAWIEARDAALMEALHKLTGTDQVKSHHHHHDGIITGSAMQNKDHNEDDENWQECEISRLVQLRAEMMETSFRHGGDGCSEEALWEQIATKMACFGYEKSPVKLKEKWETISKENNKKKRKENNSNSVRSSSSCFYIENNNNDHYSSSSSLYNNNNNNQSGGGYCDINNDQRRQQQSPSNSNANASVHQAENCFPFLMSCEGGTLWDNYSLKVNKPNQNQ
ncbi:hypothetical protein HN51_040596 [Arachis hypogaea]|uniref:Myb-like domain-containing protein n=1 Tax=Arachis hypogaea TaxID=3818 RepID=A0A444YPF9_ARAHY|nr:trihelix transcription factor PTL [Arachis hypogaea]QHN86295.1 Trihelix transcription factor PTL [Arachis hypogaea]RYR03782.1 hypothetical protein Ahy_B06g083091 [Arachis hypogaea]